jgi:hypothetical protein
MCPYGLIAGAAHAEMLDVFAVGPMGGEFPHETRFSSKSNFTRRCNWRPGQRGKADRFAPKVLKLVREGQSYREISHRLATEQEYGLRNRQAGPCGMTDSHQLSVGLHYR